MLTKPRADKKQNFLILCYVLVISRGSLAIQYGVVFVSLVDGPSFNLFTK